MAEVKVSWLWILKVSAPLISAVESMLISVVCPSDKLFMLCYVLHSLSTFRGFLQNVDVGPQTRQDVVSRYQCMLHRTRSAAPLPVSQVWPVVQPALPNMSTTSYIIDIDNRCTQLQSCIHK